MLKDDGLVGESTQSLPRRLRLRTHIDEVGALASRQRDLTGRCPSFGE